MAPTSVTVLCANAHRVNVKTNPSTSILQVRKLFYLIYSILFLTIS